MGEVLWGAFHVVLKFPYMFRSAEDALLWRFDPDAERLGPGEARLMVRAFKRGRQPSGLAQSTQSS
jgi:hypothetical protein